MQALRRLHFARKATGPHRDRITQSTETAIYAAEMRAPDGKPTLSLLRAAGYWKDNRIPPMGFTPSEGIAAVGGGGDADFVPGSDRVHYSVPAKGPVTVTVEALYQSVAPRHLEGLDMEFVARMAPQRAPVVMHHLERVIR